MEGSLFYEKMVKKPKREKKLADPGLLYTQEELEDILMEQEFNFEDILFFELTMSSMILVLKNQAKLYFRGDVMAECIWGTLDIHGYTLRPSSGPQLVLSGYGQSSFYFSSKTTVVNNSRDEFINELTKKGVYDILEDVDLDISSTVLILSVPDNSTGVLNLLNKEKQLFPTNNIVSEERCLYFRKPEEWLGCTFDIESGIRISHKMKYHENLKNFSDFLLHLEDSRIVISGGKGVGKSTTLQYMVNRMFDKWESVLVIDCDLGQPEFTVPGCVSVVLINNPLLGPNFSHLTKPIRSICLENVDAENCTIKYLVAIDELSKFCNEIHKFVRAPWLINTMGYLKGFGLQFFRQIISSFQPTHVVQINSVDELNLNSFPLTLGNVSKILEIYHEQPIQDYDLIMYSAQPTKQTVFLPPKVAREMRVVAYMIPDGNRTELSTFSVSLSHKSLDEIKFFRTNEVVAICIPWSESNFMECIGFGVIIKQNNNNLTVVTPLSEEDKKPNLDVFVVNLGFDQNVYWERENLFNTQVRFKNKFIVLCKENKFNSFKCLFHK